MLMMKNGLEGSGQRSMDGFGGGDLEGGIAQDQPPHHFMQGGDYDSRLKDQMYN